ncbi:MAG: UbiX family flavin prenyltransferase [Deferribacteraceae bacterium]|jgi:4-hydroxy-3-polyprenylbenzoate decarboxylase|nr:UbiX family flavin prenyltransferase [Deferribacteraceae bacterium]
MNRIIVGITGASGFIYGRKVLELLHEAGVKTELVLSDSAKYTAALEGEDPYSLKADKVYSINDFTAPIASGSYKNLGMIIAPCSMRTLACVATGNCDTLLLRAADVALKERRRLVLMTRESPLHAGHLKNMLAVTEMGGIIAPPVPAFYSKPESIDDIVRFSAARALDLFGIEIDIDRWGDNK